jgi:hypothetical protein
LFGRTYVYETSSKFISSVISALLFLFTANG